MRQSSFLSVASLLLNCFSHKHSDPLLGGRGGGGVTMWKLLFVPSLAAGGRTGEGEGEASAVNVVALLERETEGEG